MDFDSDVGYGYGVGFDSDYDEPAEASVHEVDTQQLNEEAAASVKSDDRDMKAHSDNSDAKSTDSAKDVFEDTLNAPPPVPNSTSASHVQTPEHSMHSAGFGNQRSGSTSPQNAMPAELSNDLSNDLSNEYDAPSFGHSFDAPSDISDNELSGELSGAHSDIYSSGSGAPNSGGRSTSGATSGPAATNGEPRSSANHTNRATAGAYGGFGQSVILSKVPRYQQLTVTKPQKVSEGSGSHISYLVTAQQYDGEKPEHTRRRFSDFARLHDALVAEFPACAVPPLPDRWRIEYIAGDRFSPEFTTKRAASLQRFLFRVSQHPSLRRSRTFRGFLTQSSSAVLGGPGGGSSGSGVGSGVGGVGGGVGSGGGVVPGSSEMGGALDHIGDALMNAFSKAKNQSKEMIDAKERAGRYEQNLATLDKAVVRASKTQGELAADFEHMHAQALKLATLEPQSRTEFERLADTARVLARSTQALRMGVDSHFACALRDMSHYVQALRGMLKLREKRQIDYEALVEYLKRAEHELVAAEHGQAAPAFSSSFLKSKMNELRGVDKDEARRQRITKLKSRIGELRDESQRAKSESDDFEELAKCEVRVFDQTEAIELQQSLAGLSDSYIEYYQTVLREFRALEATLE